MKEQRVDVANAQFHQEGFFGDVYIRAMYLGPHCTHEGHSHHVDHVSNILDAPLQIEWRNPATGEEGKVYITVPCKILVKAERWHKFTAFEKPVRWECWFGKDYDGDFKVGEV